MALCLLLFLCTFPVHGQVSFFKNETPLPDPQGVLYFIDDDTTHTLSRYRSVRDRFQPLTEDVTLNYKNQMLWLKLPLGGQGDSLFRYFMVRNPHINYLGMWLMRNDSLLKQWPLAGDHMPFSNRSFYHSDFVYPLPFHRSGMSLLLLVDKRNEMVHIPIHFMDDNGFVDYSRKKNLLSGFITGLCVFLLLFNIFLYFQMRERLYVFYGLYILMGLFYMFSDYGFSFMLLFPGTPGFNDYTRPIALCLAAPLFFLFCVELLNTKTYFPVQYKWLMRCFWCYLVIFLVSIPFMRSNGQLRVFMQILMQVLQLVIFTWILIASLLSLRKKFSYAPFVLTAALLLLVSGAAYSLYLSGNIPDTFFTRNLMNIGFSGEVSILAFVLSLRFKNYKDQSERLVRQASYQQEQIFRSISGYQERELQRLSSLLHDSIGAQLSALRLKLESASHGNGVLHEAVEDIAGMANDVRSFAHNLSPALLQKKGVVEAIRHQVNHINASNKLHIQFEPIGSLQRTAFRYELMIYNIIQELIQNIIKHAEATEAIVQLLMEKRLVSIFVEDNGKGCDPEKIKDGLGYTQIKQLVTFVRGHLTIDIAEQGGCKVSIEFTLLPDEQRHSYHYR